MVEHTIRLEDEKFGGRVFAFRYVGCVRETEQPELHVQFATGWRYRVNGEFSLSNLESELDLLIRAATATLLDGRVVKG